MKEMYEDRRYEIKVRTNFDESIDFSSFHTFAHSGMTDRGRKIAATDNQSPLRMRSRKSSTSNWSPRNSGKSAWKTVQTCW